MTSKDSQNQENTVSPGRISDSNQTKIISDTEETIGITSKLSLFSTQVVPKMCKLIGDARCLKIGSLNWIENLKIF